MQEDYEYHINKILSTGSNNDMHKLKEVLITAIDRLDNNDYNEINDMLYEISEGKVLTQSRAEKIINSMKPFGMKWTIQETEEAKKNANYTDIRPVDFWIVMNSAYNDYHDLFQDDIDMYVDFTDLFINDEDAVEDKVYLYFTKVPRKD